MTTVPIHRDPQHAGPPRAADESGTVSTIVAVADPVSVDAFPSPARSRSGARSGARARATVVPAGSAAGSAPVSAAAPAPATAPDIPTASATLLAWARTHPLLATL